MPEGALGVGRAASGPLRRQILLSANFMKSVAERLAEKARLLRTRERREKQDLHTAGLSRDYEGSSLRQLACEARGILRAGMEKLLRRRWKMLKTLAILLVLIFCLGSMLGIGPWSVEIRLAGLVIFVHVAISRILGMYPFRSRRR